MLELCKDIDAVVMDETGKLLQPELEEIAKELPESSPAKFLKDPKGYLNELIKKAK